MNLLDINAVLKNLSYPKGNEELIFVERQTGHQGVSSSSYSDGVQDEYDEHFEIYKLKSNPELYVKFQFHTDSYGNGASVQSVQFVKPVQKTVTVFE